MNPESFRDIFAHMEWADSKVWATFLETETGLVNDPLLDTLFHLHHVQRAYLEIWLREPYGIVERDDFKSVLELRDWAQSYYEPAREFVNTVSPTMVDEIFEIPWTKLFEKELGGPAAPVTLGETLYQVAAHSTYHRGQANRRLREIGLEPPLVDHIVWLWMNKPAPVWP